MLIGIISKYTFPEASESNKGVLPSLKDLWCAPQGNFNALISTNLQ